MTDVHPLQEWGISAGRAGRVDGGAEERLLPVDRASAGGSVRAGFVRQDDGDQGYAITVMTEGASNQRTGIRLTEEVARRAAGRAHRRARREPSDRPARCVLTSSGESWTGRRRPPRAAEQPRRRGAHHLGRQPVAAVGSAGLLTRHPRRSRSRPRPRSTVATAPSATDLDCDGRDDLLWYGPGAAGDLRWAGHPDRRFRAAVDERRRRLHPGHRRLRRRRLRRRPLVRRRARSPDSRLVRRARRSRRSADLRRPASATCPRAATSTATAATTCSGTGPARAPTSCGSAEPPRARSTRRRVSRSAAPTSPVVGRPRRRRRRRHLLVRAAAPRAEALWRGQVGGHGRSRAARRRRVDGRLPTGRRRRRRRRRRRDHLVRARHRAPTRAGRGCRRRSPSRDRHDQRRLPAGRRATSTATAATTSPGTGRAAARLDVVGPGRRRRRPPGRSGS